MKVIFYTLILFMPLTALSQTDSYNQEKELVNQIKRNNEYIYADKLDATKDGAFELAMTILEMEVNRIVADENITEPSGEIIFENLEKRVHVVELKRGAMFRAFLYITREELFSIEDPANVSETIDISEMVTIEEKQEEEAVISVGENISNIAIAEENDEQLNVEPVLSGMIDRSNNATSTISKKNTGNEILDEMISYSGIQHLQPFLEKKKKEGSVMFGNLESLTNKNNAYLIVYSKDGSIHAILDKGGDARFNFITEKENDNLSNYPDCKVAWVQIFK